MQHSHVTHWVCLRWHAPLTYVRTGTRCVAWNKFAARTGRREPDSCTPGSVVVVWPIYELLNGAQHSDSSQHTASSLCGSATVLEIPSSL